METTFSISEPLNKEQAYDEFLGKFQAFIEGEHDEIAILANTAAALKEAFNFFWVGFYIVRDNQLVLGPFQGSVACNRINKGKGVCGTAWEKVQSQVVPNVELFPGHIACSSLSKSEIVVPLICNDKVMGVLDIDSDVLATFDETDRIYLERIVDILVKSIYDKQ